MTNFENIKVIVGSQVNCPTYGTGVVTDLILNSFGKYYISVKFEDVQERVFLLDSAYTNELIIFDDETINDCIKQILKRQQKLSSIINTKTAKPNDSEQTITALAEDFMNKKHIATELISLYDDRNFEIELYSKAFSYLERLIYKNSISDKQKAVIAVAMAYIALKNYDGDLHTYIEMKYRDCTPNKSHCSKNTLQSAVYSAIGDFRKEAGYFDVRSYIAVPLVMCCVPHYRVKDLFKLSYDIYKKKLLYDEDITDDQIINKVVESFIALRRKELISNSDIIKGTSYLMSKFTQSCIYSGYGLDSLSEIVAHCIRLIISHLSLPEDSFVVEPYYSEGYTFWTERFDADKKERVRYESSRADSRPFLKLSDNTVHLITGKHSLDDCYDPNDVHIIVYNGDSVIADKLIDDPNAITYNDDDYAMSCYIIARQDIAVASSPLDKLGYQIVSGDTVIYDSKRRLYRTDLFFDGRGNEIKPGSNYSGEAFVITKGSHRNEYGDSINEIMTKNGYVISSVELNDRDVFYFDNESYIFFKVATSKMIGYSSPWSSFISNENKIYSIYSNVKILFPASCGKNDIVVMIDGQKVVSDPGTGISYIISLYSKEYGDKIVYTIQINGLEAGYHNLCLYNSKSGKLISGADMSFIVDSELKKTYVEKDDDSVTFVLSSSFVETQQLRFEYGTSQKQLHAFVKNLGHGSLVIYPTNISYSVTGEKWADIDKPIPFYEIPESVKYLLICGPYNMRAYYNQPEAAVKKQYLNLDKEDGHSTIYRLYLSYLRQMTGKRTGKVYFEFGNRSKYAIFSYTPYVKVDKSRFYYDEERKKHIFEFDFTGTSSIKAVFTVKGSCELVTERVISSGDVIALSPDDLPSKTGALIITLHMKKMNTLFEQYQDEPFYYFPAYYLRKTFVRLDPFPPDITITDKNITFKLIFEGAPAVRAEFRPTGFSNSLFSAEAHSGDVISFDISHSDVTSYTLLLYSANSKDTGYSDEPFFESKPLSPLLWKRSAITSFIFDDGSSKKTSFRIYFKRIKHIGKKHYLIADLSDKVNHPVQDDLVLSIINNNPRSYELTIYYQRDGKLKKLRHKNGKIIAGIIINKREESNWRI